METLQPTSRGVFLCALPSWQAWDRGEDRRVERDRDRNRARAPGLAPGLAWVAVWGQDVAGLKDQAFFPEQAGTRSWLIAMAIPWEGMLRAVRGHFGPAAAKYQ